MSEAAAVVERQRSPGFPIIPLGEAIAKAESFYKADKSSSATPETLAHHWSSSVKSSAFLQWIASLKRFDLLEEVDGPGRQLKLTRLALDIVMLPEGEQKRADAIKKAALSPKAFRELWDAYKNELPSDHNLKHQLVTTKSYKPDAAADLIRQYKRTVAFAKLVDSDKIAEKPVDPGDRNPDKWILDAFASARASVPKPQVAVGDMIQWESQGIAQFPEPRRVTGVSDDGTHVFAEGTRTGLPITQVKVHRKATEAPMTNLTGNGPTDPPINPSFKPAADSEIAQNDFPIYLSNNKRGVLYMPATMTAKDYSLLKRQIESHLAVIEATAVADETPQ